MLKTEGQTAGNMSGQTNLPIRVVLTGFRATGKSLVGSQLANLLGYRFIDTDEEIVAQISCSIASFVREHGWNAFRKVEKELLARLAWMHRVVIATGGGAVLHTKEWQELRSESLVIWLQADARTIRARLKDDPVTRSQRPPLTTGDGLEEIESILAEREEDYREGSDMAIDTTDTPPAEIAVQIKEFIMAGGTEHKRMKHGR